MCHSLIRFQEYAESPYFRKKVFTRSEFRRWARTHYKDLPYDQAIAGFNIPSWSFRAFLRGKFDKIHPYERTILNSLKRMNGRYYVIAVSKNCQTAAIEHELAHALYYVDKEYKNEVNKLLKELPKTKEVRRYLLTSENIYHIAVINDEIHAYLATDTMVFARQTLNLKDICNDEEYQQYKEVRVRLRKILDTYLKKYNLTDWRSL